jgi:hypothetical protein
MQHVTVRLNRNVVAIAFAALALVAAVSVVYARRLRGEVDGLRGRIAALEQAPRAGRGGEPAALRRSPAAPLAPAASAGSAEAGDRSPAAPGTPAMVAPPPAPSAGELPPPFDDDEAREALRRFVADELARQRSGSAAALAMQRQEQLVSAAREQLGLTDDEERRLASVLVEAEQARAAYFEELRTGAAPKLDISARMTTLRNESQARVREVLGEERFRRFVELQRERDATRASAPPT